MIALTLCPLRANRLAAQMAYGRAFPAISAQRAAPLARANVRIPHWRMTEDEHWELKPCASCRRHVRCGETACPFCGAALRACLRIPEFKLKTKLNRGLLFSIGAALTSAGIVVNCTTVQNHYGTPAEPGPSEGKGGYCFDEPPSLNVVPCGGDAGAGGEGGQSSEGGQGGTSKGGSSQGGAP
jgi:hypothetical protein